MRKTNKLFRIFFRILLSEMLALVVLGCISFSVYYNTDNFTLDFGKAIPVIYLILICLSVLTSLLFSIKIPDKETITIKSNINMRRSTLILSFLFTFLFIISVIVGMVKKSISASFAQYVLLILSFPMLAYFILSLLPTKKMPDSLMKGLSVCSDLWGVSGIFSSYFYTSHTVTTTSTLKILMILNYVFISLFFLYQTFYDFGIPKIRHYVFGSCATAVISIGFCAPTILSIIFGKIPLDHGFSIFELMLSMAVGFLAFERMYSLKTTVRYIVEEEASKYYSKKFDKTNIQ